MPIQNTDVARLFDQVADLLSIGQGNAFRVRAYRNAARTLRGLGRSVAEMLEAGEDLGELPGIGEDLAGKIAEIVATGRLALIDELERDTPHGLLELLALPGLGPKRVSRLQHALGVENAQDLLRAAQAGRVRKVEGFGPRTERVLVESLMQRGPQPREQRALWSEAAPVAGAVVDHLRALQGVEQIEVAGSFRRHCETVGDLDVVAACAHGREVTTHFVAFADVAEVLSRGATRATVRLRSGMQVDLRVVESDAFGAALLYLTGSKAHNVALRRLAQLRGLKLNEYGLHHGRHVVASRTEQEIYRQLGMSWIPPELREDRGEIDAARHHRLPKLLEPADLHGDLHVHTRASDGAATVEQMAAAAQELGLHYLAVTDHTESTHVAHGLDARALRRHLAHIDAVNAHLRGFVLLRSAEVDILADGSLDLDDGLLRELDVVVCGVHSHLTLPEAKQTERVLRAMDHPSCHVLSHPTCRLLGHRDPIALDLERILTAAADRGVCLELNAQPQRLDLPDVWLVAARQAGCRIAIATDAHSTAQLGTLGDAVRYARRGWIEAEHVLNARPWSEARRMLRA